MRRSAILLLATLLGVAAPATADSKRDHERARNALEAGEIQPLALLLARVEQRYVGRVIETELERDDGRWVYRFKLLPPSGAVYRITVDAATGEVVRTRGPAQERRR